MSYFFLYLKYWHLALGNVFNSTGCHLLFSMRDNRFLYGVQRLSCRSVEVALIDAAINVDVLGSKLAVLAPLFLTHSA
ncbi:hypothetical protein FM038_010400 [Shewanella eurypsychrophilus]|uniref:Secreted protein n=1 Tax=Shewanella eurypsychrophilus TaxID=2593656 RepID=A0ABX6V7J1_9GAMM|nr:MULTISPECIES: hypothetical protein [Shewanella]QFU22530.1 hypothetical protein FS418_11980 [Shewanella sp. YLB-09]QPG57818.1 hypothetical protein FM038_010400 [Shewanella eurypsychrophilus]